jgi:hypothetical protein
MVRLGARRGRLRTADDVDAAIGVPVLAAIPTMLTRVERRQQHRRRRLLELLLAVIIVVLAAAAGAAWLFFV